MFSAPHFILDLDWICAFFGLAIWLDIGVGHWQLGWCIWLTGCLIGCLIWLRLSGWCIRQTGCLIGHQLSGWCICPAGSWTWSCRRSYRTYGCWSWGQIGGWWTLLIQTLAWRERARICNWNTAGALCELPQKIYSWHERGLSLF